MARHRSRRELQAKRTNIAVIPHSSACRSASPFWRLFITVVVALSLTRRKNDKMLDHHEIATSNHISAVVTNIALAASTRLIRALSVIQVEWRA